MNHAARLAMSPQDYLAWEAKQERKHELVNGIVRAMAGASVAHNRIAGNTYFALRLRLAAGPCEPFGSDLKVRTGAFSYRYPDVTVECGKPAGLDLAADEPAAVFEVLSPSTDWFDATDKLEEYKALETMRHIVLLSQSRPLARVWSRSEGGWTSVTVEGAAGALDGILRLDGLAVELPLGELYAGVAFS